MISTIRSAVLCGLDMVATDVEVGFSRGIPGTTIVGLPDGAVRESRERIRLAVIAVPASAAQQVVDLAIASGIKALLSFSPGTLKVPRGVKLKSVDLTVSLEGLSFHLARKYRKRA